MLPVTPSDSAEEFRVLTPEEIQTVEYVFTEKGVSLPDPAASTFVGCVKAGKVVAFLVLQLKIHAQPLWIEDGHAAVLTQLVAKTEQTIIERVGPQWVYLFSPAGRLAQLAQSMGMQLEPWVVLSKLVVPDQPILPAPIQPADLTESAEGTIQ